MYIFNVAIDVPLYQLFSYTSDENITIGSRVLVQFGSKKVVGFVFEQALPPFEYAIDKLKPILQVFNEQLASDSYELIKFAANYYHYPIGQTLFGAIPQSWRKTLEIKPIPPTEIECLDIQHEVELNSEQQHVVDGVTQNLGKYYPSLLYGITGSGKTEVYLSLIKGVLQQQKQVLVMVPEINLTPQLLDRFKRRFPSCNIHVLTSNVTSKQRLKGYLGAQNGEMQIIIGTRLSVFTPFKNLALIIVDEEHDQSFKQHDSLRYHARDLAVWRGQKAQAPVVLGSATPSLETLYNYKQGKYALYKLTNRGVLDSILPEIRLIDLNTYQADDGLTDIVCTEIEKRLKLKELSMVFINRRGYSPIISCYQCGWIGKCKNCSANLVYHSNTKELKCHYCGVSGSVPKACPACSSQHLQTMGQGTQKIEELLVTKFPQAQIYRIDQDTLNTKAAWSELYTKIKNHEIDILVGTQILAKGHDFHNLTLVVGLNIDHGLYSYDFRASEFLFTQLTQVAGRAGRGSKPGVVLLQTNYPKHELYQYLIKHDFNGFVNYTLKERKSLHLPPYSHYVMLRASGVNLHQVLEYLNQISAYLATISHEQIIIYPALPAILQRLKNRERAQILLYSQNRPILHQFLNQLTTILTKQIKPKSGITWQLDIDPFEL